MTLKLSKLFWTSFSYFTSYIFKWFICIEIFFEQEYRILDFFTVHNKDTHSVLCEEQILFWFWEWGTFNEKLCWYKIKTTIIRDFIFHKFFIKYLQALYINKTNFTLIQGTLSVSSIDSIFLIYKSSKISDFNIRFRKSPTIF